MSLHHLGFEQVSSCFLRALKQSLDFHQRNESHEWLPLNSNFGVSIWSFQKINLCCDKCVRHCLLHTLYCWQINQGKKSYCSSSLQIPAKKKFLHQKYRTLKYFRLDHVPLQQKYCSHISPLAHFLKGKR